MPRYSAAAAVRPQRCRCPHIGVVNELMNVRLLRDSAEAGLQRGGGRRRALRAGVPVRRQRCGSLRGAGSAAPPAPAPTSGAAAALLSHSRAGSRAGLEAQRQRDPLGIPSLLPQPSWRRLSRSQMAVGRSCRSIARHSRARRGGGSGRADGRRAGVERRAGDGRG